MRHGLALLVSIGLISGLSCSSPPAPADLSSEADLLADGPRADSPGHLDGQPRPDAGHLEGGGADASLPGSCTAACAIQSLTAKFGSVTEPFERSVYGLERDASGKLGVYVEALHGGFSGCPAQSSPTPDRTLVIANLPLPVDSTPITRASGLAVTLLDFKGTLLKGPVSKATAATVTFRAANICTACLGKPAPSHPEGFVAFDLEATFAEGTVSGHLFAVHCDSLE